MDTKLSPSQQISFTEGYGKLDAGYAPPISHRYLAVRSGIGHFGYSGNIITKEYGSAIVLASVVTDAELIPTEPLPEEENYCDECKLCLSVCSSEYVDPLKRLL